MNIALIAHDSKKELMVQFCIAYCGILSRHNITRGEEQNTIRRVAVTPGAARLLIIRLDAHRHIVMNDVADI